MRNLGAFKDWAESGGAVRKCQTGNTKRGETLFGEVQAEVSLTDRCLPPA